MKFEKITFTGHSAVFFESPNYVAAIDPWLEGNPLCPSEWQNPKRLDLIILTHGHADHSGDAVRLSKKYGSKIVANWELGSVLIKEGAPESHVILMNKGGTIKVDGLSVTLTHAMHSSSYDTSSGPVYAGEPCGIVLQDDTNVIYHAGDTALFSDMKLIGETYRPRIGLFPIGDRFTMGPKEAARAVEFTGCKVAIPIHYGTFDMLTGTAEEFKKSCANLDVEVAVLEPGKSFRI